MNYKDLVDIGREAMITAMREQKQLPKEISDFIDRNIHRLNAYACVNEKEIADLANYVFSNPTVRDFVMELQYQFFARFALLPQDASGRKNYDALVSAVLEGCQLHVYNTNDRDALLMPAVLQTRQFAENDLRRLLYHNKWLLALLAVKLVY